MCLLVNSLKFTFCFSESHIPGKSKTLNLLLSSITLSNKLYAVVVLQISDFNILLSIN